MTQEARQMVMESDRWTIKLKTSKCATHFKAHCCNKTWIKQIFYHRLNL